MGWLVYPVRTKDEPVGDDYIIYSSVVDAPIFRGSRLDILRYLVRDGRAPLGRAGAMIERADENGSSTRLGDDWGGFIIMEGGGPGWLPRERLRAFCDVLFDPVSSVMDAAALLDPLDDHPMLPGGIPRDDV